MPYGPRLRTAAVAAFAAAALAGHARADVSVLSRYDLVALTSANTSSDVEGPAYVGGNLTGAGTFGNNLPANAASYKGTNILTVAGTVSGGTYNVDNGGNVLVTSSGSVTGNGFSFNGGGGLVTGSVPASSVYATELAGDQAGFSALTSKSTINTSDMNNGVINLVTDAKGQAVLTLYATDLAKLADVTKFTGADPSTLTSLVINVVNNSGSSSLSLNTQFDALRGSYAYLQGLTVFNFDPSFKAITLNREFDGTLLAPDATLTGSQPVNGGVFVNVFNSQGEVHYASSRTGATLYQGPAPGSNPGVTAVSEPPAMGLVAVAAAAALAWARKRSRRTPAAAC